MKEPILQIIFGSTGAHPNQMINIRQNPEAIDFAWSCLRYFRTGAMPASKDDTAAFAASERLYFANQRRWRR